MLDRALFNPVVFLALALLALGACTTPTPYQSATADGGYAEQQIESNRFRVSFAGNALTPRDTVENYLLYRASELTLKNGKDYFVVANRQMEPHTVYQAAGGPIFFDEAAPFGEPWEPWPAPLSMSAGVAMPITDYVAYADIQIFSGRKPENDPHAYDARDVIARLGPTIKRPEQAGH